MASFISYPVSTQDSHISPRLPYHSEGQRLIRESRVDTGYDIKIVISDLFIKYFYCGPFFPTNAFDKANHVF